MGKTLQLNDLREAEYNPRIISQKRLDNLQKSMVRFGDLSGVVYNEATKKLISGHQRLKTLREAGLKTKIVTTKVKDKHGTTGEGHIVAETAEGTIRIPLRVVNWTDKKAEMAANIAANAHGGDFDRAKLGALLVKLEKGKDFDIDVIGLDPLSLRGLMQTMPAIGGGEKESGGDDDEFPEFDENSFELHHTCPKCKFRFNASATSKAPPGKKENKQVEAAKKTKAAKKKDADNKVSKKSKGDDAPVKKKSKNKDEPVKKSKKDKFKKIKRKG